MVVDAWLGGSRYADIFTRLPAVQRSSRTPTADFWLRGSFGADNWSEEYDKFLDFVTSVLERFLPWLLHACKLLARHIDGPAAEVDWEGLQATVEARVLASEIGDAPPSV